MGNGDTQGCSRSAFCIFGDHVEDFNVKLLSKGSENRSDEEGSKEAKGHGSQGVDEIRLNRNVDIFPFQKFFDTGF